MLIERRSAENYAIITDFKPTLVAITVSLWIKTTKKDEDKEAFFITYEASSMPNAFAISNTGELTLTIADMKKIASR